MKKILIILALFCFTMSFANLSFAQTPGAVTCEITDPDTGVTAKDTDCDNVADENDNCPEVRNGDCEDSESFCDTDDNGELDSFEIAGGFQIDSNRNDIGDACDDRDADSVSDAADNCPDVNNPGQTDSNDDQIGDACTDMSDDDEDGIAAFEDNCPFNANPAQTDSDNDGLGNECDNCRYLANPAQADDNDDAVGNACQNDRDSDGLADKADNCIHVPNADQKDDDEDGFGNLCDNCPFNANPDQTDNNQNAIGDVCEAGGGGATPPNNHPNDPSYRARIDRYASGGGSLAESIGGARITGNGGCTNSIVPAAFNLGGLGAGTCFLLGLFLLIYKRQKTSQA